MNLINIKGTALVRDINTMAVLNNNKNELEQYKTRRKILAEQKNQINTMEQDIAKINSDISDIREMLTKLINR